MAGSERGRAKAHGIYLILNMHIRQGGFQSNNEGGALWSNTNNQGSFIRVVDRARAPLRERTDIAGYALVDEPAPLTSRKQWQDLAVRITTAIRTVDGNHMVFINGPTPWAATMAPTRT